MQKMVEELIHRLLYEFLKQDKSSVYGFTQRDFSYNSNRIEGSTLTEKQTETLFETGSLITDGKIVKAKDIEEMRGHFAMFNEMLKTYSQPLTQELIKQYHYQLKSGLFEDKLNGYPIGEYKSRMNLVSDIETVKPIDVPQAMEKLLLNYQQLDTVTLLDLAKLHAQYEMIHPFQDGNGRTGRIILYKECLKHRIFPFVIHDENKAMYYRVLNEAQHQSAYENLSNFF